jgi:hypothetical protein
MSTTYFIQPEAKSKLGKHIITKVPLYQIPRGAAGVVINTYEMGNGFGVIVSYNKYFISDEFSKENYERLLEEV